MNTNNKDRIHIRNLAEAEAEAEAEPTTSSIAVQYSSNWHNTAK